MPRSSLDRADQMIGEKLPCCKKYYLCSKEQVAQITAQTKIRLLKEVKYNTLLSLCGGWKWDQFRHGKDCKLVRHYSATVQPTSPSPLRPSMTASPEGYDTHVRHPHLHLLSRKAPCRSAGTQPQAWHTTPRTLDCQVLIHVRYQSWHNHNKMCWSEETTYLIPVHILVPREKGTKYFARSLELGWSQRSGENTNGLVKISGLLCMKRLFMPTGVCARLSTFTMLGVETRYSISYIWRDDPILVDQGCVWGNSWHSTNNSVRHAVPHD